MDDEAKNSPGGIDTYAQFEASMRRRGRWVLALNSLLAVLAGGFFVWMWMSQPRTKESRVVQQSIIALEKFAIPLPGDRQVELVGFASDGANQEPWWKPDGTVQAIPPDYPAGSVMTGSAPQVNYKFLIRVRGTDQYQSLAIAFPGSAGWSSSVKNDEAGNAYVASGGVFSVAAEKKSTTISVGVAAGTPTTRTLDSSGRRLPDNAGGTPEDITVTQVIPDRSGAKTELQFTIPTAWRNPRVEIFAIDTAGQRHHSDFSGARSSDDPKISLHTREFPVLPTQIDRFEYQLWVYRNWAMFDNVSLEPGRVTNVGLKADGVTPGE